MKKYAVIVAGGSGTRMGGSIPKQFLLLHGKSVLQHTVEAFLNAYPDMEIILVLPEIFEAEGNKLVAKTEASRIQIAIGGPTRFHSVQNGLKKIKEDSVIFIHDAVRCLVSDQLIWRCYEQAIEKGSAVPAVAVTDTIRMISETENKVIDRNLLRAVQTPQTFRSEIILKAFEQQYNEAFTDEATVAEAAGYKIFMTEGEKENIKITLPSDLVIAAHLLKSKHGEGD